MHVPGMGIMKSVVYKIELITTSHWYILPISLMFSIGIINESLYTDEELTLLTAITLLILLTWVLPVVQIMSNVLLITPTTVTPHCNINGWWIIGLSVVVTSTVTLGSTSYNKFCLN